jgi:hypothetical protein
MGCINGGGGGGGRLDISAALAGAQIAIARALAVTVFATANLPLIIKNPPRFVPNKSASKRDASYVNDSKKTVTAVQQTARFDFGLSL